MGKAEETKSKLLMKAAEIIAVKGYASTTTKEIADSAGVSEGTLFKYYGSKDRLLFQMFQQFTCELQVASVDGIQVIMKKHELSPSYEKLYHLYEERIVFFTKHQTMVQIMLQELAINQEIKNLFNEQILPNILKIIYPIIEEGKMHGELKPIATETIAAGFIQLVLAPFTSRIMFSGLLNQNTEAHHSDLIKIYLEGIRR